MSLVTRGIGGTNGALVTAGLGAIILDDQGAGGSYQVTPKRISVIKTKPAIRSIEHLEKEQIEQLEEVLIKIEDTEFQPIYEAVPTVSEAIKAIPDRIPEIIERIQKEVGVSKRKARSLLRKRVAKELKAAREISQEYITKDDLIEILIITGVI